MNVLELPKAELHVHLSGAIPTNVVERLTQDYGVTIPRDFLFPNDLQVLRPVNTLLEYFKPWFILKQLPVGKECLSAMIRATTQAAAADNVKYMELRHSITAMSKNNNISHEIAIEWILEELDMASAGENIDCRLIVSISRYQLTTKTAWSLIEAIKNVNYGERVVGVDLAGNEDEPIPEDICEVLRSAKEDLGLGVTVHAGETGQLQNVLWAIDDCKADRIGHGLAAIKDDKLLEHIKRKEICLEICLTSNLRTNRVKELTSHPLHNFIRHDVPFVLCSDNPAIHQASLSYEYELFLKEFGMPAVLQDMYESQCKYAFGRIRANG